jgi:hypothetical protein
MPSTRPLAIVALLTTEAVALGDVERAGPCTPCVREPRGEHELGREIPVANAEHLKRAGSFGDCDAAFDLVETAFVAETAPGAADDDVKTSALLLHPERLDERQRLGSRANRLLERAAQHQETGSIRQRLGSGTRQGTISDCIEGVGDVAVGCGAVAGEPREACGQGRRLSLSLDVPRGPKSFQRLVQQIQPGATDSEERTGALEQQTRTNRIFGTGERDRVRKELRSRCVRGQRKRPFSCCTRPLARTVDEVWIVRGARGPRELERLLVVVRKQLGVVLRAPEIFDPFTRTAVLLRPSAARDLAIRDVAEEHVLERVLRVVGDCRAPLATDEVLALQRPQQPFCIGGVGAHRGRDAAEPEHLPVDSSLVQQLFLGARQPV